MEAPSNQSKYTIQWKISLEMYEKDLGRNQTGEKN